MIILILGILLLIILAFRIFSKEDTWICEKGQWIKHGNPSSEKPSEACE